VQTFVPSESLAECARVLDRQRLGKQRVETLQIARALCMPGYGWQTHPAVAMWRGELEGLLAYQEAITYEWTAIRGYKDTCYGKTLVVIGEMPEGGGAGVIGRVRWDSFTMPAWWGDYEMHASHRSQLLAKDPEWYGQWGWDEIPGQAYVWPVGPERMAG
jgi:hypothetical protein